MSNALIESPSREIYSVVLRSSVVELSKCNMFTISNCAYVVLLKSLVVASASIRTPNGCTINIKITQGPLKYGT